MRKGFVGSVIIAVVIIVSIIGCFMCANKVPAGYVGIVYNMNGGVQKELLTQGWHILKPTQDVTLYSIGVEQSYLTAGEDGDSEGDDSFEVPTSDGKGLQVELTFTYRYDIERVTDLFVRFRGQSGKEVRDSFIKPNIVSWTKEVTARYPVSEILGDKRASINTAATDYIKEKFDKYGIIIENVSLVNIDADKETRASVQKKVEAQQELELAQIQRKTENVNAQKEKEIALIKAEQEKEVAVAEAEKAKIAAEGEAEATKIKAAAEAEANKKIAESLTPEFIELEKYHKWKGDVPKVTGQSTPIIGVDNLD